MKNHSLQLKYPGGKTHVAQELLVFAPTSFDEYRDPFCGNCPWITHTSIIPQGIPRWINDLDEWLYAYLIGLRDDPSWIAEFWKLKMQVADSAMKMRKAFFEAIGLLYRRKCPKSYLYVRRLAHRQIVRPIKRNGASMLGFHFFNTGLRCLHLSDIYEAHDILQGVQVTNQDGLSVITAPTDGVCFMTIDRTPLCHKLYENSSYAREGLFRVFRRPTRSGMTGNKDRQQKTELVVMNYDD